MVNKDFTPRYERTLAAKLRPIASKMKQNKQQHRHLPPMKSPMELGKEGVDHINIWDRSESLLGRALSTSSTLDFHHPVFLHFNTVEGFWTWVSSHEHDDRLRIMTGGELREFSKKCRRNHIANFQAIVMEACWEKVKQHSDLRELIAECKLPFDCYYIQNNNLRIRPAFAPWMIAGFEEIRKAIIEAREPDFEFLRERGDVGTPFYKEVADEIFSKQKAEQAKEEAAKKEKIASEGQGVLLTTTPPVDGENTVQEPIVSLSDDEVEKLSNDIEKVVQELVPDANQQQDNEEIDISINTPETQVAQ